MTFNPTDLLDKDSALVEQALQSKCGMCKAAPTRICIDIISGKPLHEINGRWVHMFRFES